MRYSHWQQGFEAFYVHFKPTVPDQWQWAAAAWIRLSTTTLRWIDQWPSKTSHWHGTNFGHFYPNTGVRITLSSLTDTCLISVAYTGYENNNYCNYFIISVCAKWPELLFL